MSDVTIKYKGQSIATMDASGTKTLQTQGKYCEGDIGVEYVKPAGPSGTKSISITQNGTTTEDVTNYASAEITVDVQGGGDGGLTLIESVTLAEEVNAVRLDFAGWEDAYDFLVVVLDAACAASEWVYGGYDTTSPALYAPKNLFKFVLPVYKTFTVESGSATQTRTFLKCNLNRSNQIGAEFGADAPAYYYAKLYSAANKFSVGSKFAVYGGTYAI